MKINWKLRLKNKTTLVALIGATLSFVYMVLGLFDVVPSISQNELNELLLTIVNVLSIVGIVTDPTTKGLSDSTQAIYYNEPKQG